MRLPLTKQAARKVEGVAQGNDFRFFAGVGGGDGKIENASGSGGGEQRHFGFKLKMMTRGEPGPEPRSADETESALAIEDAAAAQQGGHPAVGPAAQERHARGIGKAIADNEVGVVAHAPEAFEIGGVMLAVAVDEKYPLR